MKILMNTKASQPSSLLICLRTARLSASLLVPLAMATLTLSVQAVTRTWDAGGANPTDFGAATNWSGDVLPSVATPDTAQFDGSVAGTLSLLYTNAAYVGAAGNAGILLNITATQTSPLTISAGTGGTSIRLNNSAVTIASGAGAFSIGTGIGTPLQLTMGGSPSTQTLINNSINTATIGSEVFFSNGGGGAHTNVYSGTGNWTLNCSVSNGVSGSIMLIKTGSGTLTLNGANAAYSGGTVIGTGGGTAVVRAAATQALGTGTIAFDGTGNASTARLELTGGISLNNAVNFIARANATVAIENISGNNTLSGASTLGVGGSFYTIQSDTNLLTLGTAGATAISGGAITKTLALQGAGNGAVVGNITAANIVAKSGAGTWTLSGSNSYAGGTTISAGTLVMASTNALGTNGVTFSGTANATLDLATDGSDYTNVINGGSSTTWTIASDVKTGSSGINHTLGTFLIGSGSPALQLNITRGPNVTSGTPQITAPLILSGGGGGTTIVNPTTASMIFASATATGTSKTLQLDGTNTGNAISGAITDGGTNIITLVKTSTSTWTFGGINTYTGNTTISQGTLVLGSGGAINGSPLITLTAGATLDISASSYSLGASQTLSGSGSVAGNFSDNTGSQILPGGSGTVGILTFSNNLNLAASDTNKFDFAAGTNDLIVVNGNLNPSVGSVINLASLPPGGLTNGIYTLMQIGGTLGGSAGNFTITGKPSPSRQTFAIVYATLPNRVQLQVSGSPASLVWLGTPGSIWDVLTTANWTNAASLSTDVYFDGDNVSFTDLGSANQPVLNTNVAPGLVTFNSANNYVLSGTGAISGSGALTKSGSSTLTITTTNNYTGATALNGGTVSVNLLTNSGVASALGAASSASANLTFNGGKLQYTGDTTVTDHGATLNASGATLEVTNPATTLTVSGAIAGNSGGALTKTGNGTLVLSGANSYNGATTVSAGTLTVSGGNGLPDSNAVIVADLAGVALNVNASETIGSLNGGGLNGGNATLTGTLTLGGDNSSTAFGGAIGGTGGLTKTGAGTFTLTNNNTFTGSLVVRAGSVVLDTGGVINNTAFNSIGFSTNDNGTLTVKGTAAFTTSQDFNVGDSANAVGTLNIQDSANISLNTFYVGSGFTAGSTASGTVNQTGGNVTESNAGIGTFAVGGRTSTNAVGIYNLSGGSLTAAAGIRVGGTGTGTFNLSSNGTLTANGGINIARIPGSTGTFNLNGGTFNTVNIASSTGVNATNNFNGGTVRPTANNTIFMQGLTRANIRDGGVVIDTANFNITINQPLLHSDISGDNATDGGLTKQNGGTLTLAGTNTYTGPTVVTGGALAVNGSIGASTVTVNSGATLSGIGVLNGATTNLGGTITPGASAGVGVLTVSNSLALDSGTTAQFNFGTGTNSKVVVTGAVNVSGTTAVTINYISGSPVVGTYTLMQYGSLVPGSFANLTPPTSPSPAFVFTLTNDTSASAIKLVVTGNPASLVWIGDGGNNFWDNGSSQNWTNATLGAMAFFYDSDNVTFNNTGFNTPSINLTAAVAPGSVTVNSTNDYDFAGAGPLVSAGNLIKSGTGTLTLEVSNSYANVSINAGTVQVGAGGTTGALNASLITNNGALAFNHSDAITNATPISGSGSLTLMGGGSLSLNVSNSYDGGTFINNGIIYARNNNSLGSTAGGTTVTSGAELYIVENTPTIGAEALTLSGTGVGGAGALRKGGASATIFGGAVTLAADTTMSIDNAASLSFTNAAGINGSAANANLTLSGTNSTGSIAGPLALGAGGLTVNSSGTWTLGPLNNFTGLTAINAGILQINDASLGNPATFTANQITLAGGKLEALTNVAFADGKAGFTLTANSTLIVDTNATLTISNEITGAFGLTKWLPGTLVLATSNTFTGTLFVDGFSTTANDGITRLAAPNALAGVPAIPGTPTIQQRNNNSGYSTLQLDGTAGNINLPQEFALACRANANPNIENLNGSNTLSGNIDVGTGGNFIYFQSDSGTLNLAGTLQFVGNLTGARNYAFTGAGNHLVSGAIVYATNGAPINVVMNGTGTLTLAAANTYSNTTTLNSGLLLVNGSITSTGGVSVVGGTLGGSGTINDTVTANAGATLFAGKNGSGNLTINGNLTLNAAATNHFMVTTSGGVSNKVVVAGLLSPSNSVIQVTSGTALGAGTYNLFTYGTTNGTSFNATPVFDVAPAGTAAIVDTGAGQINLVITPGFSASTNAYLTGITLNPVVTFAPAFASNTLSGYIATENYGSTFTVTVTNADLTATNTLTYNGSPVGVLTSSIPSGSLSMNPNPGITNLLSVLVTAQDGATTKTYAVDVVQIPSQAAFKLTNSVSGGTNLVLTWPQDHTGYRLLTQTNNLNKGVSKSTNDWGTVAGYTTTNAAVIPITKTNLNSYYRLVYP